MMGTSTAVQSSRLCSRAHSPSPISASGLDKVAPFHRSSLLVDKYSNGEQPRQAWSAALSRSDEIIG